MAIDAERIIRGEIQQQGSITFARFMELALYAPGVGYYEREGGQTGRAGDFYTSVSVGPVLGFLLAHWVARVCADFESIDLVEAAAHDGRLAGDVLDALSKFHPGTAERVRYTILEPSETRRAVQRRTLEPWADRVVWRAGWADVTEPVRGVVFSNELLDAMPVHRLVWDAGRRRWQEWGVTVEAGRLAWCRRDPEESLVPQELAPLTDVLPEGFVVERSPAAAAWWSTAARSLGRGWLMALDYGFDEDSVIRPERAGGTARGYSKHRRVDDLLANPGEQDLTAHVDFPRLIREGEAQGLETVDFLPQGRWLGRWAMEVVSAGGEGARWLVERARGLQTLTHPAHLGHSLRVLVQASK
jgi:SAM-dependent MidA family methyltransferase